MSWQTAFDHLVLVRGRNSFLQKKVFSFVDDGHEITAKVMGEETYDVFIAYTDRQPTEMECSCSYAKKGNHCKHMAAVCFYWEDENHIELLDEVQTYVSLAPENDMRTLLLSLVRNNRYILQEASRIIQQQDEIDIPSELDRIIEDYTEDDGGVLVSERVSFTQKIHEYIERHFDEAYCEEEQMEAFVESTIVYNEIVSLEFGHEVDLLIDLVHHLCSVWVLLLEGSDQIEAMVILDWLVEASKKETPLAAVVEEFVEDIVLSDEEEATRFS